MKQTKIVASISDRRCDQDFIRKLFFAGMNVVRMNTAHATEEGIRTIVKNVRAVSPHIGIMIDTKGPEVRTTDVKEPIHYNIGDVVKIFGRPEMESSHDIVNLSYPDIAADVKVGDDLLIDAGELDMKVIDNQSSDDKTLKASKRVLQTAIDTAAATDTRLKGLLRYDLSISNAITSVVKEREITDLVLGLHKEKDIPAAFLGNIVENVLQHSSVTTFIYKPVQPLATIKRHLILIPDQAEKEIGFIAIMNRIWNVLQNTGAKVVFYGSEDTLKAIKKVFAKRAGEISYTNFSDWDDFLIVFRDVKADDCMWVIFSRKEGLSYDPVMPRIPGYLNKYFQGNSFVLSYPIQASMDESTRYLT